MEETLYKIVELVIKNNFELTIKLDGNKLVELEVKPKQSFITTTPAYRNFTHGDGITVTPINESYK